jgi:quercetin dioxygenase-like cupin family protein
MAHLRHRLASPDGARHKARMRGGGRRRACGSGALAALVPFVFACGWRPGATAEPQVLVGAVESQGLTRYLATRPLAAGQGIRNDEIGRTPAASHHLVQIATAETPHRHRAHDLTVTLLLGEGVLHVEERTVPMRAGDVAVVARGVPHWFVRTGDRAAVTFVVFTPPLDAPDTHPVEPNAPGAVDSPKGRR